MQNHLNSNDTGPRHCNDKSEKHVSSVPTLSLEVCRGKTQFPQRELTENRCLFGSSPKCDVQLGGSGIPLLHCLLYQDGADIWLDAISPSPQILVNGEPHKEGRIENGDCITIGCFEFKVHQSIESQIESVVDPVSTMDEDVDVSDLSAAELVELIEQEEKMIEEFESQRAVGAEALLDTIRSRMDSMTEAVGAITNAENASDAVELPEEITSISLNSIAANMQQGEESDAEMLHQIETVLEELNLFAETLQKRSESLIKRESTFAEATETLLEMQNKMAAQLESLTKRLAKFPEDQRQRRSA